MFSGAVALKGGCVARGRAVGPGHLPTLMAGSIQAPRVDPDHCQKCGGGNLKIIAAILKRPVIEKIFCHLGLDPQPLARGRAREPGQYFPA